MTHQRYAAAFSSTDDPDLDAQLLWIEDDRHTIPEIVETCQFYGVRAHVLAGDRLIGKVSPNGTFTATN